ncbi:MAG: glycosyltransferase family 4 protein [Anaerolineae bacterium]
MVLERASDQGQLLIISHEIVGPKMAGPGIRYYHLARVLARQLEVGLAAPEGSSLEPGADFALFCYRSGQDGHLEEAIRQAQAVLIPAILLVQVPSLLRSTVPLVIDGYDPFLAETLALSRDGLGQLQQTLTRAYLAGDFFICASERQRDWWLGLLEAHGRVNAWTFQTDPSLRCLVDVVPFGLPEEPARHTAQVVKGVWPGIDSGDRVILWGGGLWPWLDPLTAIRAMARLKERRPDVRLIFPGTRHPNPNMAGIPTHHRAAVQLAQELGLLDKTVFFGDWVPYADWPNVLLESDLALTLHFDTLETRLAFRSRVLDYVWASLPIVATRGDATGELVVRHGLGLEVDYEDAEGVAEAMLHLLEMPGRAFQPRFERVRRELTWERAARPLVEFCRRPRRAPDKAALGPDLGNPFYLGRIAHLQTLVEGYEQGRFIRLMRWFHRLRGRAR